MNIILLPPSSLNPFPEHFLPAMVLFENYLFHISIWAMVRGLGQESNAIEVRTYGDMV